MTSGLPAVLIWIMMYCGSPVYYIGVSKDSFISYPAEKMKQDDRAVQVFLEYLKQEDKHIFPIELTKLTGGQCV